MSSPDVPADAADSPDPEDQEAEELLHQLVIETSTSDELFREILGRHKG